LIPPVVSLVFPPPPTTPARKKIIRGKGGKTSVSVLFYVAQLFYCLFIAPGLLNVTVAYRFCRGAPAGRKGVRGGSPPVLSQPQVDVCFYPKNRLSKPRQARSLQTITKRLPRTIWFSSFGFNSAKAPEGKKEGGDSFSGGGGA